MKMRKHRIKGVEYIYIDKGALPKLTIRFVAGNGYHRKTFDWESY